MMDTQTFFLLRFGDRSKLPEALQQIEQLDGVARLTAVDGHYSLILESTDRSPKVADSLTKLDGFGLLHQCELVAVEKNDAKLDETRRYCYVFVEVDKGELDRVLSSLKDYANIDLLVRTTGDYNIVARLHGKDFDEIDRLVAEEVGMLDGVLRLKSDRVIELDTM